MRHTGNRIVGSNPTLSATHKPLLYNNCFSERVSLQTSVRFEENARRSRVPGVGHDKGSRPLMERAEGIALVELSGGHGDLLQLAANALISAERT